MPEERGPDGQWETGRFNKWLDENRQCGHCPMYGRGTFVGVDSAGGKMGLETILFLGLNPGNEEARIGKPFVGPSGKFLRQQFPKAGIRSWAMTNSLLCSSANEAAICKADEARACCRRNAALIYRFFRSPIIVPCGNGAWSIFRTRMAITAAAEKYFVSRGPNGQSGAALILPIFHPSALIRSGGEAGAKYPAFLRRLEIIGHLAAVAAQGGVAACVQDIERKGLNVFECFH